jgi:hypothetical protein
MRPSVGFVGLLLVVAPTVLAQIENAPELNTVAPGGDAATNTAETSAAETTQAATTNADETAATSQAAAELCAAPFCVID